MLISLLIQKLELTSLARKKKTKIILLIVIFLNKINKNLSNYSLFKIKKNIFFKHLFTFLKNIFFQNVDNKNMFKKLNKKEN